MLDHQIESSRTQTDNTVMVTMTVTVLPNSSVVWVVVLRILDAIANFNYFTPILYLIKTIFPRPLKIWHCDLPFFVSTWTSLL